MTNSTQLPVVAEKRKPPAAGRGRKKGEANKITRALKDAILFAAEAVGEDGKGKEGLTGYLKHLAKKEPKAYAMLLGKVLPITLASDSSSPLVVQIVRFEDDAK